MGSNHEKKWRSKISRHTPFNGKSFLVVIDTDICSVTRLKILNNFFQVLVIYLFGSCWCCGSESGKESCPGRIAWPKTEKKIFLKRKKILLKSIGIILGKNYPGRKVKFKTIFLIDKKIFLKHFCQEMEKGNKSVFALNVKVIGLSWYAIFESTAENNTWSEFWPVIVKWNCWWYGRVQSIQFFKGQSNSMQGTTNHRQLGVRTVLLLSLMITRQC